MKKEPASRPGGRSSRVKDAVFEALESLMAESGGAVPSMGAIAERAGVNPTSLYRRWGDAAQLALDVAIDRLMRDFPVPDTGTLRGDLMGWATSAVSSLGKKKNFAFLRILAASSHTGDGPNSARMTAIMRRGQELNTMLERARARGEAAPHLSDVLEIVLAPIYLRILLFGPIRDKDYVPRLVDRAIALAPKSAKGEERKEALDSALKRTAVESGRTSARRLRRSRSSHPCPP